MGESILSHRRTHNLLLISKLLSQRDGISPITLILDSLEQPSRVLIQEFIRRAEVFRSNTIFLSFENHRPPLENVTHFVACWKKEPAQVLQEVRQILSSSSGASTASQRFIFIFDSLHQIASHALEDSTFNFPSFLSSFLKVDPKYTKRQLSVVAAYHTDIPLQPSSDSCAPSPLAQLNYLATSVITLHSVAHLLAHKRARDRSLAGPVFGLDEESDGVVVGLNPVTKSLKPRERGIVIELEHRRKSGRGVIEWFFLPSERPRSPSLKENFGEYVILLGDHPLFEVPSEPEPVADDGLSKLTFDLSLTDRQRLEREGVVLPYYDAQKAEGGGEGGRIIYEMGAEDDFDDEEDED